MKKSVKHKFQYLLFFLLSMPAFIFASAQDIRVNIDFTKASLGSVLNEIGRQTSLSIVYNTGDVNPTQPVSIKASNEPSASWDGTFLFYYEQTSYSFDH